MISRLSDSSGYKQTLTIYSINLKNLIQENHQQQVKIIMNQDDFVIKLCFVSVT